MSLEDVVAIEDRNQMYCLLTGDPAERIKASKWAGKKK